MAEGFFGRVLLVDLSTRTTQSVPLSNALYREVLGGYGLGVKILYNSLAAGVDPLGAENVIGFVPGLLTGTGALFGGRFMVVGKSPLTGGWGDSNCGGHFGPALRSAGIDGLFVSGVADDPVYIVVDEDGLTLHSASHLWGLQTGETEDRLAQDWGGGAQVLSIGPAGENQALIAAIVTDKGRAAARSGLAAVMGAKGLKAVVARGRHRVPVHDGEALASLNREYGRIFRDECPELPRMLSRLTRAFAPILGRLRIKPIGLPSGFSNVVVSVYRTYGTCSGVALATQLGDAPVANWRGVGRRDFNLSRSSRISDDAVVQLQTRRYSCRYCPVGCGGILRLEGDRHTVEETHKPEYETLVSFGPLLLNDDLEAIVEINSLCNRYGLDTISTGVVVAFAIECAERGLIEADLGGTPLTWGNASAIVQLVRQIAHRDGIGDLLADGVKRAAERIGGGAARFAMHAGGQELPMHDPRYEPLLGLAYVVDPTPGRHNTANSGFLDLPVLGDVLKAEGLTFPERYEYEKKGVTFAVLNRYLQTVNCAGLCMFSLMMGQPPVREWINAVTGWTLDLDDLLLIGHRIQVLRHAFNLREGIRPEDVSLPDRAKGHPPLGSGPLSDVSLDMETMKRGFFRGMGYDDRGVPSRALLEELELPDLFDDMEEVR